LLTQDPLGLAGGVNLYAYAGSNPVAFSDPYGLCTKAEKERGNSTQSEVCSSDIAASHATGPNGESNDQYVVGIQGLIGGGPLVGVFVGGGTNLGVNENGQFFIQFQASGGLGVGLFGGVGVQAGGDRASGALPPGVSDGTSSQLNANVGLFESAGVSANFDNSGKLTGGSIGPPIPKVGVGLGAQASVHRVKTVTIATRPIGWLRRLVGK